MNCPNCDKPKMGVEETRTTDYIVWRVRRCRQCGWRVTTKEGYAPQGEQMMPHRIKNKAKKWEKDLGTILAQL